MFLRSHPYTVKVAARYDGHSRNVLCNSTGGRLHFVPADNKRDHGICELKQRLQVAASAAVAAAASTATAKFEKTFCQQTAETKACVS